MPPSPTPTPATAAQLRKATAAALLLASAVLLTTVLPAEYGIDPTGIGQALGLKALPAPTAPAVAAASPAATTVIVHETPFQSRELTVVLQPGQGAEIKARMRAGESFVFGWTTDGGPVNFDLHGERPNDGDAFTSHREGRSQPSDHGQFSAPFDGSHGWYWQNPGAEPVTVSLKISGWFETLYMP